MIVASHSPVNTVMTEHEILLAPFRVSAVVPSLVLRVDSLPIARWSWPSSAELEERVIRLVLGYRPNSCREF
jgi:hypothetical protein